jgi:hypothetical protein
VLMAAVAAMASVMGAFSLVALARDGETRDELFGFGRFALGTLKIGRLVRCPDNLFEAVITA